jgi:multidrug efflux system membrane fusion protein
MKLPASVPAALLALLLAAGCGQAPPAAKVAPPVPVVTAVARKVDVPVLVTGVGNAAASNLVSLRPRIGAVVAAVRFREGETVAAGAPLFTLDPHPWQEAVTAAEAACARARASVVQAEAALARDRAQLVLAEADAGRIAGLEAKDIASRQQVDQARAGVAVAQAALAGAEAAIATARAGVVESEAALARAQLDRAWCDITAPIAGRTGPARATPGTLVTAGSTELVTIACTQPMWVEVAVPAAGLPALRAAAARGAVAASVLGEGLDGPEPGTLELIDNRIDSTTATVAVRVSCPNRQERLWPGQQCRVELVLGVDAGVVTVPAEAIQAGQRGDLVWVVGADRTAQPRPVQLARRQGELAVVAKGLAAGDEVVVDGQVRLRRGSAVVPAASAAAVKPAAAASGADVRK